MCADRIVRFIKKCLHGDERTDPVACSSCQTEGDGACLCCVHEPSSTGNSPTQVRRRWTRSRNTDGKRQRLPSDIVLQTPNICGRNDVSEMKQKGRNCYIPLSDNNRKSQSQQNIYVDPKGGCDRYNRHSPYRTHPDVAAVTAHSQPLHLQPIPYRALTSSSSPAWEIEQRRLNRSYPSSVRRSMDGEERCGISASTRRTTTTTTSPKAREDVKPVGVGHHHHPPPNRTVPFYREGTL